MRKAAISSSSVPILPVNRPFYKVMKPGKTGTQKKKAVLPSEQLEQEARRMEERLVQLREHMQQEKERRLTETRFKDGSKWRGGLTTKPLKGYADAVLKAKPRPRPGSRGAFVSTRDLLNPSGAQEPEKLAKASQLPCDQPENEEIREFLESCGLEKHLPTFLTHGIEDMEVVLELTEEHLADLSLPLGHRIKLLKRIRDLKSAEPLAKPPVPKPSAAKAVLPAPTDSFSLFKEAVDSFRNGGTATTLPKSSVEVAEPSTQPRKRPVEVVPAKTETEGTDAGAVNEAFGLMKEVERETCWECYRIFSGGAGFLEKRFCCADCVEAFKAKHYLTCACGSVFTRDAGELWGDRWFCSENCTCLPHLPELEEEEDFVPIDPATGDPITP